MAKSQRRLVEESKNARRQLEREREELRRQLPGLDGLRTFFLAAGVGVELKSGRCLLINGSQTGPLSHLPPPDTLEWNSIVSEIALKYLRGKFIAAVRDNACFDEGVRVVLVPRERGFEIMRGGVRLAIIQAARAQIPHGEGIRANFLIPGPHWHLLADVVSSAEGALVTEWEREDEPEASADASGIEAKAPPTHTPARQIDHLPEGLDPELLDVCLDASRRIRLERQVAYERPVVLESVIGELTLLPISTARSRLLMPFQLMTDTETLTGELVMADRDPLPLLITENVADENAIAAWTCALLGFADATCVEFAQTPPAGRRDPAPPRPRRLASVPRTDGSMQTLPREQRWPSHLEPVGQWIHYSGSFVAGHRRRLRAGQSASDKAHDRARQVGIILHPHETWVRAHARGVPDGVEMRFAWNPPAELKPLENGPGAEAGNSPGRLT
jgi:hypothetical protein